MGRDARDHALQELRGHTDAWARLPVAGKRELRYGSIAVDQRGGMGCLWSTTSWGAVPGSSSGNFRSRVGTGSNTFLSDPPEKSVVYGPAACGRSPLVRHQPPDGSIFCGSKSSRLISIRKALGFGLALLRG